jgi:hypothetical protein
MADISPDLQRELDQIRAAYKAAVDEWVKAIRDEEALALGNITWPSSTSGKRPASTRTIHKKKLYEDALRREFFGF